MKMSLAAAIKLKIAVHNYLDNCFITVSEPHRDASDLFEFLQTRNKQIEDLSKFVKESIEVEIPPRYLGAIQAVINADK